MNRTFTQMNRRLRASIWTAALAIAVGLVAVAASAGPASAGPNSHAIPAVKAARMQAQIDAVRAIPTRRKPSIAQARAMAVQAMPPTVPYDTGLTAGIVDLRQGPFPATEFQARNSYREPVGNRWLFLFAGAAQTDVGVPETAVRIYQMTPDNRYTQVGEYRSPVQDGELTVTGASGTTVRLATAHGRTVTFSLTALAFG